MASTAPLLERGSSGQSGHLSIGMVTRLKKKAHQWRERSHEHTLDHAMAVGGKCMHTSKMWEKNMGEAKGDAESYGEEAVQLQTNTEAVTNLLNNCLGSGILVMPFAVKNLGIGTAVIAMILSALLNRYTLLLVIKCCEIADIEVSYNTLGKHAFGQAGRLMVIFCFFCLGFCCLVSYVDGTADSLGDLLKIAGVSLPMYQYQIVAFVLLFPATYIRSLKSAATLSMIAFIGALTVVACINFLCGRILLRDGLPDMSALKWFETDTSFLFASIPTCLTVFSIQAGGSIILSTLQDHTERNTANVASVTKAIAWVINMSVGVPVYVVFQDAVQPDALSSFGGSGPVVIVAKLAILDLLILSYMFMMIPCRVALIELFFKKNEAKMEASQGQFLGVTTAVNLAALGVGLLVSDLSVIIGIMGAAGVNLVAFILPCSIYMKVRANPQKEGVEKVPIASLGNAPYMLIVAGSFYLMVMGLATIVGNMMHPPQHVLHAAVTNATNATSF